MVKYFLHIFFMAFVFQVGSCQENAVTKFLVNEPVQDLQNTIHTSNTENHTLVYKVITTRLKGVISVVRGLIEKYLPLGKNFVETLKNHALPIENFIKQRVPSQVLYIIEQIVKQLDAAYSFMTKGVRNVYGYIPIGLNSADTLYSK